MNQNLGNNQNQAGLNNATSNTGAAGVNSNMTSGVTNASVGVNAGTQNVQQIRQQVQTLEGQLRQVQNSGANNQAYTDAANRLQDVYEILNKLQ
ncbi:MAG: hypothetical protein CVV02_02480 [Firmicutes bacterium HGW-Firmicutes-7]|nr:MAG: hypothetical protein CVV02_02480 [Firmicutes bacterium HGW-Firmicutes-7]